MARKNVQRGRLYRAFFKVNHQKKKNKRSNNGIPTKQPEAILESVQSPVYAHMDANMPYPTDNLQTDSLGDTQLQPSNSASIYDSQAPSPSPDEEEFIFCTNCGNKILSERKFCSQCGQKT